MIKPHENIEYEKLSKKQQEQVDFDNFNYILNKLFTSYKHINIREKQLIQINILEKSMTELINDCDKIIKEFTKIGKTISQTNGKLVRDETSSLKYGYGLSIITIRNMLTFIINTVQQFIDRFLTFFTLFMDIYFLRRFLDKDYITNAITYTGSYHSCVYIYTLVKDYNFHITHVAYPKNANIKNINQKVKNAKEKYGLEEFLYPPTPIQCSDITHFPDNFL